MNSGSKIVVCLLGFVSATASAGSWRELSPGLDYAKFASVHVFRIDLRQNRIDVIAAKDYQLPFATARTFATQSQAKLVINGGYFSPEYQSLGLIVRKGKMMNPLHPTPWWSIFHITDNKPQIEMAQTFQLKPTTEMALQVGPRLVINGEIPRLKPATAQRSCIGFDGEGRVYLIATENDVRMEDVAHFLRKSAEEGGLGLTNAMNLDGGTSTQIYAAIKNFRLDLPGEKPVANALAVFPR